MRLFGSKGRKPDWFCVNLLPDRVDVCHVLAAGKERPEIALCDSYRKEGGDVATLDRLRRELHLDRYRCTTLLRGGAYQMVQVEAPEVPEAEVKSAVRWKLKDLIDYPVETATVDALFIPQAEGAPGRVRQMLAVAAKNDIIAASVKPFNDADIPLEVIDIPELAQRNVAQRLELVGRALALLAFDDHGGLLTFTCGGELYQHRRIDVSLATFAGTTAENRKDLYDRLVLELQRSLDHFDRQFRTITVAKVMVTPVPGADDMREHLAANLDVPVALVHLSELFDFPRIPELHEAGRQAQCLQLIGAALREQEPAAA
jgi:MSHA biogenesis protein MshI